jgi:hypothetical protein
MKPHALRRHLLRVGLALCPLAAFAVDDVTVQNTTYTTTQTVQADNSITATPAVVVANGANVTFKAGARITLGAGFSVVTGGVFHAQVGQSLPFTAGFETGEGYTTGSVHGQRGWSVSQGAASITTADFHAGTKGLALESGASAASVTQGFVASSTPAVTFFDLYVKPVATASAAGSSLVQTEAAKVGFQIASGQGEVYTYDGVGANQWLATGHRFALTTGNRAADWQRLTLRLDYTAKAWDLFLNGTLIDYDLAFVSNSETHFRQVALLGVTTATAYADALAAGATNPLFTDADKDGLPDAWESANGLNPAIDDRNGNLDGDVYTNIQEHFLGTSPTNADVTKPAAPAGLINTSASPTALSLAWAASTDSGAGTPGIAGYNLYRNGTKINGALLTATGFDDTGLTPSTLYAYTVRAVDLAGNLSDPSTTLNLTTPAASTTGSFEVFTPLPQ